MLKRQSLAGALALLILLSLVHSCIGNTDVKTIVVFKGDSTEISNKESHDTITKRKPNAFRVPAFVGGVLNKSKFFAVFSDAYYGESAGLPFIEPAVKTSNGNCQTWNDAVTFGRNMQNAKEITVLRNVTAVMSGDKIYALATSLKASKDFAFNPAGTLTTEWDTVMFVGTVVQSTESSAGGVTITWGKETSLKGILKQFKLFYNSVTHFVGGVGNGVVMKNGTIVFPIQIKNGYPNNHFNQASSIIYSSDNGTTWHMGSPAPEFPTSEGSVVEWSDGKLLLSVRFDFGFRVVFETDDMGVTWKEFPPFSRVWGNHPDVSRNLGSEGSAITVPVDGENILLVSHPQVTEDYRTRETLQLWVSDGKRINCVGKISEDDKGEQTGNSILAYVGEKLYVTHEINPFGNLSGTNPTPGEWDKVIALSLLQDFLKRAQKTVREWKELDKRFQSKDIPADGLVGYLGNTTEKVEVWEDVYKCVNATVKNAESVEGGFCFNGSRDSYALWPVERQGQNQVYKFTDKQFTLAATVIIHNTSRNTGVSFLGIGETTHGKGIMFGLGYTEDRKWYAMQGWQITKRTQTSFNLGKEYYIAITFANGKDTVYVNGEEIISETTRTSSSSSIDFFYMGSTGENTMNHGSSCTVKNVMLFNRSFKQEEIHQLSKVTKIVNVNEPTSIRELQSISGSQQNVLPTETTSKPKNDHTALTTDAMSTPESDQTVSTTETTIVPENDQTVSITGTTSLPESDQTVSIIQKTGTRENHQPVLPTETRSTQKNDQPVSPTKNTSTLDNERIKPKTETISITDIHQIVSTTQTTSTPKNEQKVLTTETSSLPENNQPVLQTETTQLTKNHKEVTITKRKESAVGKEQKINNGNEKARTVDNLLRKYRNTTFEEEMNRADSAAVPLAFVKIMCFICSIIVLAGV